MGNWARTCYFDQREKMLGRCSTNSSQLWFKFNDLSHPVIKNERECEKWKISKWKKQISAWTLEGNSKLSTAACFFKPLNRTLVQFFSKRFGIPGSSDPVRFTVLPSVRWKATHLYIATELLIFWEQLFRGSSTKINSISFLFL